MICFIFAGAARKQGIKLTRDENAMDMRRPRPGIYIFHFAVYFL